MAWELRHKQYVKWSIPSEPAPDEQWQRASSGGRQGCCPELAAHG